MIRNLILIAIAVVVLAALYQLGQSMYRRDAYGLRTAMSRRSPANFEGKVFGEESLEGAFLPYARFRRADLGDILMRSANLQFADFTEANFNTAGIGDSDFSHAILDGARLRNARWLDSATFRHARFRNTDLSWVSFHGLYGRHRLSKPKHMLDPTHGGADLSGAIFEGANCQHTIFSRCVLKGAIFNGGDCREADFTNADLRNADFTGADLRGAKLEGADTTGAVFTNTKR